MAVFSKGGFTSPDLYIGISCIVLTLICTGLNFVVFRHNYIKKSSVARTLYLLLSATDLATAWFLLAAYSVYILEECKPDDDGCGKPDYYRGARKSSTELAVYTIFSWTMSLCPAHITAFLAATRFFQIKYPLRRLKVKLVVSSLLLTVIWTPLAVGSAMLDVGGIDDPCSVPFRINILLSAWTFCPVVFGKRTGSRGLYLSMSTVGGILQIGAIAASILTIHELVKVYLNPVSESTRRNDKKARSSVKVLLTNLGSLIAVSIIISTGTLSDKKFGDEVKPKEAISYLLLNTVVPAVISTLNPIIYIILTPGCTQKLGTSFNTVRQSVNLA